MSVIISKIKQNKENTIDFGKLHSSVYSAVLVSMAKAKQSSVADMRKPKKGKVYPTIQKGGRVFSNHQASAPGESPAVLTGTLINSIREEMHHSRDFIMGTVYIDPRIGYASVLNNVLGRPIFDNIKEPVETFLFSSIEKAIKESLK
ncbi:hypothetical protein [Cognatishimia sp.]|uniref:hypothetical protein n=1 Tax=Cognatishimia sp. TaxID=2211648 RepID=UPI0035111F07|nr:hypothetical protein [Cognatishimia sp.]